MAPGQVATYAADGLLGPDLQIVHMNSASAQEIVLVAAHGTPVSVSPFTELLIGPGRGAVPRRLARAGG